MTQAQTGQSPRIKTPVRNNVYTVLVTVAAVALAVAVGFVAYKNTQLTKDKGGETHQPFYIVPR